MEKEGLEQFKDVGGCWGCGLELTNQQLLKDYIAKRAECEKLKNEIYSIHEAYAEYYVGDSVSVILDLKHKLQIATEALEDVVNLETMNYDVLFWICKHALERIESEEQ